MLNNILWLLGLLITQISELMAVEKGSETGKILNLALKDLEKARIKLDGIKQEN